MELRTTSYKLKFLRVGFSNTLIVVGVVFAVFTFLAYSKFFEADKFALPISIAVLLFFIWLYSRSIAVIKTDSETLLITTAFGQTSFHWDQIESKRIYKSQTNRFAIIWINVKGRFLPSHFHFADPFESLGTLDESLEKLIHEFDSRIPADQ